MSPVSRAGGGRVVQVSAVGGCKGGEKGSSRGRFATDFEVKEVIGTGNFGTVYKVRRLGLALWYAKCCYFSRVVDRPVAGGTVHPFSPPYASDRPLDGPERKTVNSMVQ